MRRIEGPGGEGLALGDLTDDGAPEMLAGRTVWDLVTGERLVELGVGSTPTEAVAVDDLDGDGRADLAVALEGAVHLVSTATGSPLDTLERPIDGEPVDFPHGLAAPGDLNRDGRTDLVVGDLPVVPSVPPGTPSARRPAGPEENWLHLYSGADGSHLATVSSEDFGTLPWTDLLGTAPDRDGDGHRDLLVGGGMVHVTGVSGSELVPGSVQWLGSSVFERRMTDARSAAR